MEYYFEKRVNAGFEEAASLITGELKKYGFGVLTEINMHEKFKEKLGRDYPRYRILGACNPAFAWKAVHIENKIGTMLPCSIIVREISEDVTEVAAIDPYSSMKGIGNPELLELAGEVGGMLKKAVEEL